MFLRKDDTLIFCLRFFTVLLVFGQVSLSCLGGNAALAAERQVFLDGDGDAALVHAYPNRWAVWYWSLLQPGPRENAVAL
ncbi:MAG: hypothetical protein V4719_29105 [Planctomycetota bacterium]